MAEIAADQALGGRETLWGDQLGPVVEHRDAEAHGTQHRSQGQGTVTRTKKYGPLPYGKRHGEGAFLFRIVRKKANRAIQGQSQITGAAVRNMLQQVGGQGGPGGVRAGNEGE